MLTALLNFEFAIKTLCNNEYVWLVHEELVGGKDEIGA